jgi:hypothetical protein
MRLSRRRLLLLCSAALIGSGSALFARRPLYHAVLRPGLPYAPPEVLRESELKTLLAAVQAFLGETRSSTHYEAFFRWRAENLPGYGALYRQFAAELDRAAETQERFVACPPEEQRRIVRRFAPRDLARLRSSLFDRRQLRFTTYVVQEILALFARTDAWVRLGYESWPGVSRGLETYRLARPGV